MLQFIQEEKVHNLKYLGVITSMIFSSLSTHSIQIAYLLFCGFNTNALSECEQVAIITPVLDLICVGMHDENAWSINK